MKYLIIFCLIFFPLFTVRAESTIIDSDNDGLSDNDEITIYHTNPNNADTDGDGYLDGQEVVNNYSPLNPEPLKLKHCDYDNDGLSDDLEIKFHTDLTNSDTDGDGYTDGEEVSHAYNPLSADTKKLSKKIEVNIKDETLSYYLDEVELDKFPVSAGVNDSTPKGEWKILNKSPKAWSPYGLWMPYWLGLGTHGEFGIHELPIWPSGYREGEDHLGTPVSHGCIRLGIGPAETIYNFADVGTPVTIN